MRLHRSNRTERLLDDLVEVVREPLGDPFERECIVVQGLGMERWLSFELSKRLGVWADPWFPFPRRLLELVFAAAAGTEAEPASRAWDPASLAFVVAATLAEAIEEPGLEPLRAWVGEAEPSDRTVELSVRIADAFDRYLVYRPAAVESWDAGEDDGWESRLWRLLTARVGKPHFLARARAFLEAAGRRRLELPGIPPRVSLFGISTLPPLFVDLFAALARHVEVHLFMLSPSSEFWAHVRTRREALAEARRAGRDSAELEELHLEIGNPLLAANGRLARDFQGIVEGRIEYREGPEDLHVDPGTGTMLAALQSDVLRLRDRRPRGAGAAAPLVLDPADRSVEVHACHSPTREVEVLRDRLLALFADASLGLEPRDVVVMTPSIDVYAPAIEAAFGGAPSEPRIPYRVADRSVRKTDGAVAAFFRVLDAVSGRFGAATVVDLLELEPVRSKFAVDLGEIEAVRRWVSTAGIRWGVDAAHRAELELPAREQNTWRFGLDRLFLGHAMSGEASGRLFAGCLPVDGIEGGESDLLGRFADLVTVAARFRERLAKRLPVSEWAKVLVELVGATLEDSREHATELGRLRGAIEALARAASDARFEERVELRTVRDRLEAALSLDVPSAGFLSGGVTVCAMMPMRSIPFRVVCLLGLSDGVFPRSARLPSFDRMASERKLGDRSVRDDDRFLFLEALLAARDRLLVTYVGQSVHDNADLPPSVVVSELLDVLDDSFAPPQGRARDAVLVRHPLQPFSESYFDDASRRPGARLFSFSRLACDGARGLAGREPGAVDPPFVVGPLVRVDAEPEVVRLEDLVRFFSNPARQLVRKRLRVELGAEAVRLLERESFVLDALERWSVGDEALRREGSTEDPRRVRDVLRARGTLPPGVLGELALDDALPLAREIGRAVAEHRGEARVEVRPLELEIDGVPLYADVGEVRAGGKLFATFSKLGAKRTLDAWIHHLFLCAGGFAGCRPVTRLVGRDPRRSGRPRRIERTFRPAEDPKAILAELVALYRRGLERPLLFLPDVAEAYRAAVARGEPEPAARARAWEAVADVDWVANDPYLRMVFGDLEQAVVGDPDLPSVAATVLGPLESHREEPA